MRHHKEFSLTTSLAHNDSQDADLLMFDVLTVGKPLSFQARKALARRILILLTEGVLVTYKDAMVEYEAARERFSRSCLRMAACMLQGEDLNAAARLIMSMAGARQVHTPLGPDSPTPLFHSDMLWAGEIDQGLDASPITSTREASARMTDLAQEMEEWIVDYKLEAMSENELRIVVSKIRAIHESNLQVQA